MNEFEKDFELEIDTSPPERKLPERVIVTDKYPHFFAILKNLKIEQWLVFYCSDLKQVELLRGALYVFEWHEQMKKSPVERIWRYESRIHLLEDDRWGLWVRKVLRKKDRF